MKLKLTSFIEQGERFYNLEYNEADIDGDLLLDFLSPLDILPWPIDLEVD